MKKIIISSVFVLLFIGVSDYGERFQYVPEVHAVECGLLGDSDGDGVCDDGDNSSIIGDNPCTSGDVQNCDDNCLDISNPDQADTDNDSVGDVCDNCVEPCENCARKIKWWTDIPDPPEPLAPFLEFSVISKDGWSPTQETTMQDAALELFNILWSETSQLDENLCYSRSEPINNGCFYGYSDDYYEVCNGSWYRGEYVVCYSEMYQSYGEGKWDMYCGTDICAADCDNDGNVGILDLLIMKNEYGRNDCDVTPCEADLNGDDKVGILDLLKMKTEYNRTGCIVL